MAISGLEKIAGKQLARVVVKEREQSPKWQLFLLFSDNTYFEIYSNEKFTAAKDVDRGGIEEVTRYLGGIVVLDAVARSAKAEAAMDLEELQSIAPITSRIQ